MADQRPDTKVKLALFVQKRRLNILLYNEGVVLEFSSIRGRFVGIWIRNLFVFRDLLGQLLDLLRSCLKACLVSKARGLLAIVSFKRGWHLSLNPIVRPKDVL